MNFEESALPGVYIVDLQRFEDERGFFARGWCQQEFSALGLMTEPKQMNLAFNNKAGTMRGLHYQHEPHAEAKLVRCTKGAVYDVAVDARPESATYLQWIGFELSADNRRCLYLPEGFAHGYQTLADNTELSYLVSAAYAPEAEDGLRYDDPAIGIDWPQPISVISEKDREWSLIKR